MKNTQKIVINSIQYNNDEKAKEDFVRVIIDYILDNHLNSGGDENDTVKPLF